MVVPSTHHRMLTIDGLNALSIMYADRAAAAAYKDKVLGYNPIAYWMLAEAAGATAIDQVNSPAQDGTHTGVTLGQTGIGDGNTSPLYDGTNDYTHLWSADLAAAFNGEEGSLLMWGKVSDVGIWTDGKTHYLAYFNATYQNYVRIMKSGNNRILVAYVAGGVSEWNEETGITTTDWFSIGLVWSKLGDFTQMYFQGVPCYAEQDTLGTWVGELHTDSTGLSSSTFWPPAPPPSVPWDGWLAHCAVWDTPLTDADILDLSTLLEE